MRSSEENAQALRSRLFQAAREAAFAWDFSERRILVWNRGAEELYGFTEAEAHGRSPHDLLCTGFPSGGPEGVEATLRSAATWEGELSHRTRAGDRRRVEVRMRLVEHQGRAVVLETGRDVTEARAQAEALRASEARLHLALAGGRTGLWTWEVDSGRTWWSPEALRWLGVDPARGGGGADELVGRVHPSRRAAARSQLEEALRSSDRYEAELLVVQDDGRSRWIRHEATIDRDAAGRAVRLRGVIRDIHEERLAREALAASEERFRTLFHNVPQPLCLVRRADGAYLDANPSYVALVGWSRADLLGTTAAALGLVPPGSRSPLLQKLEAEGLAREPMTLRTRDGREVRVEVSVSPLDVDGTPTLLAALTDVSDHWRVAEELRASEERSQARAEELSGLLDAVPAAVWIARDPECAEVVGNRLGHALLRTPDRNLSKTGPDPARVAHFEIFHQGRQLAPDELPLQVVARSGVPWRDMGEEIRFADGDVVHIWGNTVPLLDEDGRPRGAIAAFLDVTELRRVEAALREADRRKDQFLATLSHELRNPLAPILAAARVMELRGDLPEIAGVVGRQARQLARLIDDLLDLSRVVLDKLVLDRTPVELERVVGLGTESLRSLVAERRQTLVVDVPCEGLAVRGDEVRLVQVVANLAGNAVRYTPPGGRIAIRGRRVGPQVELDVTDDGRGIEPELLPRIFELFVRGEALDRGPGLGVGLPLVKRLVELHGGSVRAFSEGAGRGARFVVRLPAADAPEVG